MAAAAENKSKNINGVSGCKSVLTVTAGFLLTKDTNISENSQNTAPVNK